MRRLIPLSAVLALVSVSSTSTAGPLGRFAHVVRRELSSLRGPSGDAQALGRSDIQGKNNQRDIGMTKSPGAQQGLGDQLRGLFGKKGDATNSIGKHSTVGLKVAANPAVRNSHRGVAVYTKGAKKAFCNGVSCNAPIQGALGDCGVPAAMTAVAAQHPELIRDAIKNNHDGTFTVRFYDVNKGRVSIRVSGEMPRDARTNGLLYARSKYPELWVGLIEKAYAVYNKGRYGNIKATRSGDLMYALTGHKYRYILLKNTNANDTYNYLAQQLAKGATVTAGTFQPNREPLVGNHYYAVLGVRTDAAGQRWVTIRNPWGKVYWNGSKYNAMFRNGKYELSLNWFYRYMRQIEVVEGLKPPQPDRPKMQPGRQRPVQPRRNDWIDPDDIAMVPRMILVAAA